MEETMKERARELGARVKETVQSAQRQFQGLEDEVQKFVGRVQDRFLTTPTEGAKKLDDLLRSLVVRDFAEKIKAIEMFKQGQAVKKDILDRFGLVDAAEVAALREEVAALKKKVANLSKRPIGVTRQTFATLKRRVEELEKAMAGKAKAKESAPPKKKAAGRPKKKKS